MKIEEGVVNGLGMNNNGDIEFVGEGKLNKQHQITKGKRSQYRKWLEILTRWEKIEFAAN